MLATPVQYHHHLDPIKLVLNLKTSSFLNEVTMKFKLILLNLVSLFCGLALAAPREPYSAEGSLIAEETEPQVKDLDVDVLSDIVETNPDFDDKDVDDDGRIYYRGAQVWRIAFDDEYQKTAVTILSSKKGISTWGGNDTAIDMLVRPPLLAEAARLLRESYVPFDVVIDDLQVAIDTENPPPEEVEMVLQNRKGHRLTWIAYHKFGDIHGYLDYLANTYPQLCSVETIGSSVEGRPLKVIRISNGRSTNKAIWIDGGMHAREWISPATVTYITNYLVENWDEEPELQNIDWYILPLANPDGYEHTHGKDRLWRKNRNGNGRCFGVDLNRNFGYRWGGLGASRNPCSETFAGTGPFSEPESRAIQSFMSQSAANFKAYLTFHSYGQYILYPWGYDRVVPPDHKDLDRVGKAAAQAIKNLYGKSYIVGPSGSSLYPASGGSDDWAKGSQGIKYSYTIELRDSGSHGFILPAKQIKDTAEEALAATKVVAKAVAELNN